MFSCKFCLLTPTLTNTLLQAILLANWNKLPPLKADVWMGNAYTIAVSKLDSIIGPDLEIKQFESMTKDKKKRSLASIAMGRQVLAGALKSPTTAAARFNQGSDLLLDWDTINLKAAFREQDSEAVDEDDQSSVPSRKSGSLQSRGRDEDELDSNESSAKRSKMENAEVVQLRARILEFQAQAKRSADVLSDSKRTSATALKDSHAQEAQLRASVKMLETELARTVEQLQVEKKDHKVRVSQKN